jgi:peptide/nickel transport system substrate-binding protein
LKRFSRTIAYILLAALVFGLASCEFQFTSIPTPPPTPTPTETPIGIDPGASNPEIVGDGKFTLRYNTKYDLNPITGTDRGNMIVSSLMYEGLFRLTPDLTAETVLCDSYEVNEDGTKWTFVLLDGVEMSDGTKLTAADAAFSINQAAGTVKLKTRLDCIQGVSAIDTLKLQVNLKYANYGLPALLDFGLVKSNSTGPVPFGSGPYRLSADKTHLQLMTDTRWRELNPSLPEAIYLTWCEDNQYIEEFSELRIDLMEVRGAEAKNTQIRRDHERANLVTNDLMFIGINPSRAALDDERFRLVLSYASGRTRIADEIFGGYALPAATPLNPDWKLYEKRWETVDDNDCIAKTSALFQDIGMEDANEDLFLEYPYYGNYQPFSLTFIVNNSNTAEVAAAYIITQNLINIGIDVRLEELTPSVFKTQLTEGNFHLYIATTKIPPDMNFLPLISENGALNYGHLYSQSLADSQMDLFAANTTEEKQKAALYFCLDFDDYIPFVPLVYIRNEVKSGRNVISNVTISPSGVFRYVGDWTFGSFGPADSGNAEDEETEPTPPDTDGTALPDGGE